MVAMNILAICHLPTLHYIHPGAFKVLTFKLVDRVWLARAWLPQRCRLLLLCNRYNEAELAALLGYENEIVSGTCAVRLRMWCFKGADGLPRLYDKRWLGGTADLNDPRLRPQSMKFRWNEHLDLFHRGMCPPPSHLLYTTISDCISLVCCQG